MSVLDVGGGFDGSEAQLDEVLYYKFVVYIFMCVFPPRLSFQCCFCMQVNQTLKPVLDMYFPLSTGLSIIAEPGVYYVSSAFTLAMNIIAKKSVARDFSGQAHSECQSIFISDIYDVPWVLFCWRYIWITIESSKEQINV